MFFYRSVRSLHLFRPSLAAYAVVVLAGLPIGRAESGPPPRPAPFSAALSATEFSGAGLGKLTEAELQELNRLVRAHESGELARVREAARLAEAEAERVVREAKATAERHAAATAAGAAATPTPAPARKESLLERIRLKPGTQIDYDTLESELVGEFAGWREGTVFTLTNGQRWRVSQGEYEAPATRPGAAPGSSRGCSAPSSLSSRASRAAPRSRLPALPPARAHARAQKNAGSKREPAFKRSERPRITSGGPRRASSSRTC